MFVFDMVVLQPFKLVHRSLRHAEELIDGSCTAVQLDIRMKCEEPGCKNSTEWV